MAADQHILNYFTAMDNQGGIIVRDAPKLDLDLYISNYKGRTRFERLLLIGQCSVPLCVDALKAAVAEAKRGKDVQRYRDAFECIRVAAPDEPEAKWDEAWVTATEKANKTETHRLESELKGYKNNLVKESIRIGHRDLGEHLESIGDLNGASETYIKMRPDASTQSHIQDVGKHIISILLQKRDWAAVLANANKVLAVSPGSGEQNPEQPYQKMIYGLAQLGEGRYYEAAKSFLEAGDPAGCQAHNDVASPNDVATYGGLLALASMDRQELQARVLDNASFRNFLELEPHIRKAVSLFVNGRYSACLGILESYRNDYLLDIYLQAHVPAIFSQIRSKCIIQYFVPFSCVTLDSLNTAFAKPGESIEPELVSMIRTGALNARINTIDRLLVATSTNSRAVMQKKALDSAKNYEKEVLERIRRMNIAAADLEVKNIKKIVGGGAGNVPGVGDVWMDENRKQPTSGDVLF
ncbi:26S proteasome subunit RPN7-domain-containing protein [Daldinia caldariorum]|uniref:26S proteasome subunit RPN7-domain-containing protein n=1 Tax=Daldinia caldariorum TaxID=326644 RepID=UPI002007B9AE|nr:26S proteasome subunit RPN7-domain-containing protein [Daldinia caldariorum]KAI1469558.1 26S proteasome subunit RPN7-domain-containing protein [Daldinia caldariorum]